MKDPDMKIIDKCTIKSTKTNSYKVTYFNNY